jgi:L-ornithine Nalpha-acyltransferase
VLLTLRNLPTGLFQFRNKRGDRVPLVPIRRAPVVYGRLGNLEVQLAQSRSDLRRAQELRYEVFYEEMNAVPSAATTISRRDEDPYDALCDHLLVVDHSEMVASARYPWRKKPRVVGTYRVLRQSYAEQNGGFYSQSEYNIAPMLANHRHSHCFMELGRSCVRKPYRNRRTVELLWQGIWAYVRQHRVDVMIGCASFPGIDLKQHALPLSFLHHFASASKDWSVRAHDKLYVDMNMMNITDIDAKAAIKAMPPLIKGYLRLGATFGEGAVIDRQFGTTDVLVILPVEAIDPRYLGHFGAMDEASSARPSKKPV